MATVTEFWVRRAGVEDVASLVGLRAEMFAAMGMDPGGPEASWRGAAARWFTDALVEPGRFAAFVVDDAGRGGPVSSAAAVCERHTPSPGNPTGSAAHLFDVSTLPGHRGRGYAGACVAAVLDWVRRETTAATVQLAATPSGAGIYRRLGFTEGEHPSMRLRIDR